MRKFSLAILALLFLFMGYASIAAPKKKDKIDKEIDAARKKTNDTVVTCSPAGKVPGTLTIEEAAKKLRPGMILRLLPGHYNPLELVVFDQDRLIVESDNSGGYVDLPLYLYGKDCIVRNINIRGVEADSGVIVDTKAHGISITSGSKKGTAIVANCAANHLTFYDNAQDITIRNTSVVDGVQVKDEGRVVATRTYSTHTIGVYDLISFGKMDKKGKITFQNCMFFSEGHLFSGDEVSMKLITLTLDDNLIWCKRSLYRLGGKDKSEIKTVDGLGKYFAMGKDAKNVLVKPPLKLVPNENWGWDMRPGIFIVTSGPGSSKEYGCNMSEGKGLPIPAED